MRGEGCCCCCRGVGGFVVSGVRRVAEHEGISNNLISDFERYVVQDVAEPWAHAQAWELRILLTGLDDILLHPITGLYEDIAHFNWHTPLESLGKCFDQLGFLLGPACLLVPGLGEAAAISFLAAAAFDAAARVTHERGASWGQAGFAMANGLLMGAGSVAGLGARADQGYLQNAFNQGDLAQMSAIKYGTDARSRKRSPGRRRPRFFSLDGIQPDLAGDGVMATLKDMPTHLHISGRALHVYARRRDAPARGVRL